MGELEDFKRELQTALEYEQRVFMRRCEVENKRAALQKAFAGIEAGTGDFDAHLLTVARCLDALTPVERAPIDAMRFRLEEWLRKNDAAKPVCEVCGWAHDDKLTSWSTPRGTGKPLTVTDGCERHKLLVYLHEEMAKNGGDDVSLSEFMWTRRNDGKRPLDILGKIIFAKLFLSTGRDRGKIRPPGLVRKRGRPKKQ